jgi:tetratricopeptide (TPR) repeat protein
MANDLATASYVSAALHRLESLCNEFECALAEASPADLRRFLERVPAGEQATLLRNLLQIELRRRRAAGEAPDPSAFRDKLMEFASVVDEELELSTADYLSLADTDYGSKRRERRELPALVRLGDYVIERELGRGAMGVVFAARHVRHGSWVALKTLPDVDGQSLQLFKREFRTLADLNHPNLVSLHTLETDGGQWFFTMDLVAGTDFLSFVRPDGRLDEQRLRSAFSQLVAGVAALHARGIVHRDLKPSNVLVTDEGAVRILDFGLVVGTNADDADQGVAGTPPYMAPEQFRRGGASFASDWYAVGVVLYQALSGRLPFTGALHALIRAKESEDPPALGDAPADLADLCLRLLSVDPALRPGAEDLLGGARKPTSPEGLLIGRDRHVADLEAVVDDFEGRGGARVVLLSGRSGEGKTALAERLLARVRGRPEFTLLAGRCYDRESVPFKAVDVLIDGLGAYLAALGSGADGLLAPDVAVLAELFPSLRRVLAVARLPRAALEKLEPQRVRRLAAVALRDLLGRLSARAKVVLFIDDLQWGDAESAELLLAALSSPNAPDVLLVGTFRSDEAAASRFLGVWEAARDSVPRVDCRLGPLSEAECVALVLGIVGRDSVELRAAARAMAAETGGNPFLLAELARGFNVDDVSGAAAKVEEVIGRRLNRLPRDARALLDLVCVSGQALAADEAARGVGQDAVPVSTITRMRNERLLRFVERGGDAWLDTYHDRIREAVLRDMDADARKRIHVALGEAIQAAYASAVSGGKDAAVANQRVYDLAFHFYEGGDARGFRYQLDAGDAAASVFALDNAVEHFKKAERVMPQDAGAADKYRLWFGQGKALGGRLRVAEGLKAFEAALPFAACPIERAAAMDGAAEMHQRNGRVNEAMAYVDAALGEIGANRPKAPVSAILDAAWRLALCQMAALVRPRRSALGRQRAALAAHVTRRYCEICMIGGDVVRYTDAMARHAYLALRSGDAGLIAQGFGKLAFTFTISGLHLPARWMLGRSRRRAESIADPAAKAAIEGMGGVVDYCEGRLAESEAKLRASLAVLEARGESWMRSGWHHHLRHIYSLQGRHDEELAEAEIETQIGETSGEAETICWGRYGLADVMARWGRLDEARRQMQYALTAIKGRGSIGEVTAWNHLGFVELQSSDYSAAVAALETSRRLMEGKLLFLEYAIHTYPLLIEALVGPDWTTPRDDPSIRRAHRLRWKARFFASRFPNAHPHTMRVLGRLFAVRGSFRKARRCLERAVESARRLGHEYQLARSLLDLAAVDAKRGQELRHEASEILRRLGAVIPAAESWQRADRATNSL